MYIQDNGYWSVGGNSVKIVGLKIREAGGKDKEYITQYSKN